MWEAGAPEPDTANVDQSAGTVTRSLSVVAISEAGALSVRNVGTGTVHVAVDLQGWFASTVQVTDAGFVAAPDGDLEFPPGQWFSQAELTARGADAADITASTRPAAVAKTEFTEPPPAADPRPEREVLAKELAEAPSESYVPTDAELAAGGAYEVYKDWLSKITDPEHRLQDINLRYGNAGFGWSKIKNTHKITNWKVVRGATRKWYAHFPETDDTTVCWARIYRIKCQGKRCKIIDSMVVKAVVNYQVKPKMKERFGVVTTYCHGADKCPAWVNRVING